jgi:hypothetical protein
MLTNEALASSKSVPDVSKRDVAKERACIATTIGPPFNGGPYSTRGRLEGAGQMDVYLSDPSRSEESGNAGREMVLRRYTWNLVVEALHREIAAS